MPLRIEVEVLFDGAAPVKVAPYVLARGERWALNLDTVRPAEVSAIANATINVACDRDCSATVANYYAPIGTPGTAPSVYTVDFVCTEEEK